MRRRIGLFPQPQLRNILHGKRSKIDLTEYIIGRASTARTLLSRLCKILNLKGRHVLVPAFQCAAAIEPFIRAGANVEFYEVDDKLQINAAEIESLTKPETALVMVVDYFGFPQKGLGELKKIYKGRPDIIILEDAVQSLFSRTSKGWLGLEGHVGLTSLRKILPVREGAWLLSKEQKVVSLLQNIKRPTDIRRSNPIKGVIRRMLRDRLPLRFSVFSPVMDPMESAEETFECLIPEAVDNWTELMISKTDPDEHRNMRRRNYLLWQDTLSQITNVKPLFIDLPAGISPFAFVCHMRIDIEGLNRLRKNGIQVALWPNLHRLIRENAVRYSDTISQVQQLTILPCHQFLNPAMIKQAASVVAEEAKKSKAYSYGPIHENT